MFSTRKICMTLKGMQFLNYACTRCFITGKCILKNDINAYKAVKRTELYAKDLSEQEGLAETKSMFDENDHFLTSGQTQVFMNAKDDGLMFEGYTQNGFRLSQGTKILGPIVIFPHALLHWNVAGVADITPESLTIFTLIEPKIDVLLIGVGMANERLDVSSETTLFLRKNRISFEILSTHDALSTWNFLTSENRNVAAVMIPPEYLEESKFLADNFNISQMVEANRNLADLVLKEDENARNPWETDFEAQENEMFKRSRERAAKQGYFNTIAKALKMLNNQTSNEVRLHSKGKDQFLEDYLADDVERRRKYREHIEKRQLGQYDESGGYEVDAELQNKKSKT